MGKEIICRKMLSSLWPLLLLSLVFNGECLIIKENVVRLRVLEYSSRNGGLQKVLNSRYSDLVVGEEVEDTAQLVLECSSLQGPLRWIYSGDGQPQHKSYYSSTSRASTGMTYTAYLSFPNGLAPKDTGQYSCQNSYNGSISNYVYLFVPKKNFDGKQAIFVPNRRKHEIAISAGEKTARIPCAVVHPSVNVSLERVSPRKSFWLDPPERIPYNPKTGFTVDVSPVSREMYTCRGEYDGQYEEVTYVTSPVQPRMDPESDGFRAGYTRPRFPPSNHVRKNATTLPTPISPVPQRSRPTTQRPAPGPRLPAPEKHLVSACTPQYCGVNAECIVKEFQPYCVCLEDYTGDAKTSCHKMSDHSQHLRVEDPCNPTPCGKFAECITINGHPLCTCLEGYYGSPPKCSPQKFTNCSKNYDCEWTEYCNTDTRKCEDICEGSVKFCGRNALCTAFSHMPYCTCPPGGTHLSHVGDPYDTDGPGCQIQSEKVQAEGKPSCNPSPCGSNAHCKVYSSYPLPICFCPQGFTGDPSHRCYKLSPAPIIDVFRPHYNTHPPPTTEPPTTPFPSASFTMQDFYRPDQLCTPEFCGENARCRFRNNQPECHCLSGYKGDPYKGCHRTTISPQALRQACSVCGPNSVCSMISSDVRCLCAPDAFGLPPNCRRSPTSTAFSSPSASSLLSPSQQNHHQVSTIVSISTSALAQQHHHHLSFSAPSLAKHSSRRNACRTDLDCPLDQICYTVKQKCLKPCSWACHPSAMCSVSNHHVHCRCPIGYKGNGRIECTPIEEPPITLLKPEGHKQQAIHEYHPCSLLCGINSVCRGVSASEMTQLRREALSSKLINMERDPHQRALLTQIKRVSGNKHDNYGGGGGGDGYYTECKCMTGAIGNPYSIEGCSFNSSDPSSLPHPPSPISSDDTYDLEETPSSSNTIVIQVDPCDPKTHPCGPHSLCVPHRGQAFCRCDFDSVGDPPNCMLRCGKEQHCLFYQLCLKGRCVNQKRNEDVDKLPPPPIQAVSEQVSQFENNLIRKKK